VSPEVEVIRVSQECVLGLKQGSRQKSTPVPVLGNFAEQRKKKRKQKGSDKLL
jgi:hypothetical protein